jgi:cbb3-type cytochrome oxidase subunit 1
MLVMFFDLVAAGLMQGFMWRDLVQWEQTVVASMPFWHLRMITGVMIIVGQIFFVCNVIMTARSKGLAPASQPVPLTSPLSQATLT